jgi:energy-coupling factor transporter ATP-binding protein EcfA2
VKTYEDLLQNTRYFRRGVFDHTKAANVAKSLKDNSFFDASHRVILSGGDSQVVELSTDDALNREHQDDIDHVLNDGELKKRFTAIDKLITKNVDVRNFRDFLERHPEVVSELKDLDELRRKFWRSYVGASREHAHKVVAEFKKGRARIDEIIKQARAESTQWQQVVELFNERFDVPFELVVANQDDVILRGSAPSIVFRYRDGSDSREVGRQELIAALSTGEQRALYLLNVIFEIEARKDGSEDTLLVMDDIADSFDYKNKYAIVEYLREICVTSGFLVIILTHNFDFFRTLQSRLSIRREQNCLMAIKGTDHIDLVQAAYLHPLRHWRANMDSSSAIVVASIPMVRNLIEYSTGSKDARYLKLTSLVHQKAETESITMREVADIFEEVLRVRPSVDDERALDFIVRAAEECSMDHSGGICLERKVALAVATRLLSERVMLAVIGETASGDVTANQTATLFGQMKRTVDRTDKLVTLIGRVVLMTPESIHLNSFMFEPLLDLSDYSLAELFRAIQKAAREHGVYPAA